MNIKALATAALAAASIAAPAVAGSIETSTEFYRQRDIIHAEINAAHDRNEDTAAVCLGVGKGLRLAHESQWLYRQGNAHNRSAWKEWNTFMNEYRAACKYEGYALYPTPSPQSIAQQQQQINAIVGAVGNFMNATGQGGGSNNNMSVSESDRRAFCEQKDNGIYLGNNKCQSRAGGFWVNTDDSVANWVRGGRQTPAWGN